MYSHPLEGTVYEKFKDTNDDSNNGRRPVRVNSITGDSIGGFVVAWLRSSYSLYDDDAMGLDYAGGVDTYEAYRNNGVSVGFTLKR